MGPNLRTELLVASSTSSWMVDEELKFIGMQPLEPLEVEPHVQHMLDKNLGRRKPVQHENQSEYEKALVTLQQKVLEISCDVLDVSSGHCPRGWGAL